MRTYTHAALSYLAAGRISDRSSAAWAAAGAALPDLPALAGSAWLLLKSRRFSRSAFYGEVCGRRRFGLPDAALHSTVVPTAPALALAAWGPRGRSTRHVTAFLLGWAGHLVTDFATHGSDARPPLWPLSRWRFESPVSYRERGRYGLLFTLIEHAALLAFAYRALRRR